MSQRKAIPGQKVSQGTYSAFIPAPLPPVFDWTPRLIRSLSDADRLIGKLAGEGGKAPPPDFSLITSTYCVAVERAAMAIACGPSLPNTVRSGPTAVPFPFST